MKCTDGGAGLARRLTVAGYTAVLGVGLSATGGVGAAEPAPGLEVLHTAEQVRRLSAEDAERHYPVRLRGVVTFFDDRIPTKSYRFLEDDTAGIYFYVDGSTNNPPLKPGELVALEGETGQGSFAPVVTSHRIEILGEAPFPKAKQVNFQDLASGQEDSQFVEIGGVVRSVGFEQPQSYYVIELATGAGEGRLTVRATGLPVAQGQALVDSTVRVRGVCLTHFNFQRQLFDVGLLLPRREDLIVENPAPTDPFAIPAQPIRSLMQFKWGGPYWHRVKVTGTVTLRDVNKIYIEDEIEGLSVQTRQPEDVRVGDHVEVLGFPAKGEFVPALENGVLRRIAPGPPVKPHVVTADEALTGVYDCRLVQIQATLLDRAQHSKQPFLVLQATNGFVFHAYLRSQEQIKTLDQLDNGTKLLVTGVCVIDLGEDWNSIPAWRAESFRILLRTPQDVEVQGRPSWWTLRRLVWATGMLCAVLLAAFGWVGNLRRRVRQQTRIIAEKLGSEAALKERYLDLFENANDMVFTHDLSGRMTSINKAGERLLQRPRGEILGKSLVDLIVEEQRPAAKAWLAQVTRGVEVPVADWDFVNAGGQKLKLEVSSRMVEQGARFIEVEGVARDVTARKRMEKEILEISNKEQQRLGHDLHDGVCQQLAAIAYRTHILARHLNEQGLADSSEATEISTLINQSLVQTRAVARGLFPVRLEEEGLLEAVEELTISVTKLYRIQCHFSAGGALPAMDNTVAMHLYFIAQEAIMNAARHSNASSVGVRLSKDAEDLILSVQDDGVGFRPGETNGAGMGIGIMRYRAKVIGAALELHSQPGRGTRITCKFRPLGPWSDRT